MTVREQGIFMVLVKFRKAMRALTPFPPSLPLQLISPSDRQRDHVVHVRNTFTASQRRTLPYQHPIYPTFFL